ncbi:ISAs1 family transposase [Streptomyces phaeochromogenes]|uniref:ISAs1 family transposase n=1 Tax=Streptomyces phaeochromogenes TaxID=1923 RepID=UPI0033F145AA
MLVNPAHLKGIRGRKSDPSDAAFLARAGASGMVMGSFVPEREIRELRDLTRRRTQLITARGQEAQRLEKELEDTGMKLSSVLSDITGASGRAIINALIGGERDPQALADLAIRRARSKIPALVEALDGTFTGHHAFMCRHYLDEIDHLAADTDSDLRQQLGLTSSTPNASTLGRLLARLDGDALDDAVGTWLARYAADPVDEPGDTLVGLAVDGKSVRGSRTDGTTVRLLAAALHACQTVIAQRQIAAKSNEIPAFAPLLDRIDLRGVVVTADAMHTQRAHAEHVITPDGHYLLVVKGNRKKLRKQPLRLPWKQVPLQVRTTGAGHGRREVRRLKVCTVRPGLLFPHAVQAMEIKRRRTHRKTGKIETKTVYAITSLPPEQASPTQLAELIRNHRSVKPCTTSET